MVNDHDVAQLIAERDEARATKDMWKERYQEVTAREAKANEVLLAVHAWRKRWRSVYGDTVPADHTVLAMIQAIDDFYDDGLDIGRGT